MNEQYLKRMKRDLTKEEYDALIHCYEEKPVRGLRINQISADVFLKKACFPLEKIKYDPDGYYLLDDKKYGNHPYHHLGAFYLQEPSAMAPVNLYSFRGDEMVLDLCASPGGKSSQLARRIPNGTLFTNEFNSKRSKVLFGNLERLGIQNAVVLNESPEHLASQWRGVFDVVLTDVPCSGEGMMRKDEDVSKLFTEGLAAECQKRDFEILKSASKMLKKDGILIYSTCTFAKEENEDVVQYLIDSLGFELVSPPEILKSCTKEGYLPNTLRFYPFTGRGEGQFMAILRKKVEEPIVAKMRKNKVQDSKEISIVREFLKKYLIPVNLDIAKYGNRYYAQATRLDMEGLNVLNYGIELGEVSKNRFIPYHHLFKALGKYFKNKLELNVTDPRVEHYLHGEEITADIENGFGVIEIDGLYLGGFKAVNGVLKNYYPKGLRNINLLEE